MLWILITRKIFVRIHICHFHVMFIILSLSRVLLFILKRIAWTLNSILDISLLAESVIHQEFELYCSVIHNVFIVPYLS